MTSSATTVEAYLEGLTPERRELVSAIRDAINANLPEGYAEGMQYGMIGWFVPHSRFPAGYHCDPRQPLPFAGLGSQKQAVSLHLMAVYGDEALRSWFEGAWRATGHKLDMGKACVRVKKLDAVPLEVIGEAVTRVPVDAYVAKYLHNLASRGR